VDYDLEDALDELWEPVSEWVHKGNAASKNSLLAAWQALDSRSKQALAQDVSRAIKGAHGGSSFLAYRYLKGPVPRDWGGYSLTTKKPPGSFDHVLTLRVEAKQVLLHWAQQDTPLSSKAFGHEKELILLPGATPKVVKEYKRNAALVQAAWMRLKRLLPHVWKPLFHGTKPTNVTDIVSSGFKSDTKSPRGDLAAQVGISTSRNIEFMLQGHFGNAIFVLDEEDLKTRFKLMPIRYPNWPDEFETRIMTLSIQPSFIRGLIYVNPLLPFEVRWMKKQNWKFPVVHRDRAGQWSTIEPKSTQKPAAS
jgi:hypothetical protein